jgi:hypothetical protein
MRVLSDDDAVVKAVKGYTGKLVLEIDFVPDTNMERTFAIRAVIDCPEWQPEEIFFLVVGKEEKSITTEDLEEVQFTSWPPVIGPVNGWFYHVG